MMKPSGSHPTRRELRGNPLFRNDARRTEKPGLHHHPPTPHPRVGHWMQATWEGLTLAKRTLYNLGSPSKGHLHPRSRDKSSSRGATEQ